MTNVQPETRVELTPKHVRAARALLAWSQQDLAKTASVATSTIADFEREQRTPVANNIQAIRTALERAEIRFLPGGAIIGPHVVIAPLSDRPGKPVRWVNAADLSQWADRIDGAVSLPTLLSQLVRATHGSSVRFRIPADEGTRLPGWDGLTFIDAGAGPAPRITDYVPPMDAGWEMSAQRARLETKASRDFLKRSAEPEPLNPSNAAYVCVTLRHWPKKEQWVKDRQKEGGWREVRAYDADDLVHWIEQTPSVGLWVARHLGKRPPGTLELEQVWTEWSLATEVPLTEGLVLSGRDEDATEVLRWLRRPPSVLSLQATTANEVVAFFHAVLGELPSDVAATYRARCVVTTTPDAARILAPVVAPLILVLTEPDAGLAASLAKQGHYVLQAYDERPLGPGEVRTLARPSREGIAAALIAAGIPDEQAEKLARDCARNLAVLRRLIPMAPGHKPKWADNPPRALRAALLAGAWDDDVPADQAVLSELAGQSHQAVAEALRGYVDGLDNPLRKVGTVWRIASPIDVWGLLAATLTHADIERFEGAAYAVLASADPRFDLDPNERWMAAVHGVRPVYSHQLRHGIGQILILLALRERELSLVPDAGQRVDAIVSKLLDGADQRRWWSLSNDFRLLAEASPDSFLSAVEESLDQDEPPIGVLFGQGEDGVFETEHLADLMWALEALAWSPELLPRVSLVLARLDALDVKKRHLANGPGKSLSDIYLLVWPRTYATLDQRLLVLDLIRKNKSDAAWRLMQSILPQAHIVTMPTATPRWRNFAVDNVEIVTRGLVSRGAQEVSGRLLIDADRDPARWSDVLERLGDLMPGPDEALATLEKVEPLVTEQADRARFWATLRRVLHDHRGSPDSDWSLPEKILDRLERIYGRFAPTDLLQQVAWLFQQAPNLPNLSATAIGDWDAEQKEVVAAQQVAARTVYAEGGAPALLALAQLCDVPGFIGRALLEGGLPDSDVKAVTEAAVRSNDLRVRNLGHGLVVSIFDVQQEKWADQLIDKAIREQWGNPALLTIFLALPVTRWIWKRVAEVGGEVEKNYWEQVPEYWAGPDSEDAAHVMAKLSQVGRARHAVALADSYRRGGKIRLASDLLVGVLQAAARQPFDGGNDRNDATMFQHYVAKLMEELDERDDVPPQSLLLLEWDYQALLQHSRRPTKALFKALSEQPSFFIQIVSAVFKPSEGSGVVDPEPEDPEHARAVATQAYRLLERWSRIPGTGEDGTIDARVLEAWIDEARSLAKKVGRATVADGRIGHMLSAAPMGADGNWPAESVREVLDRFRSRAMCDGFQGGKASRRGVTTRMPGDGGTLERHEADTYRAWARAVAYGHPYTAAALQKLAESYEIRARRQDDRASHLDWEG